MKVLNLGGERSLAYYVRPHTSTRRLRLMLGQGLRPVQEFVIDAAHWKQLAELTALANESGIETVLETRSLELSSPDGWHRSGVRELPWAGTRAFTLEDLDDATLRRRVAGAIARFVSDNRLTAVLAPTHYLSKPADAWFDVDLRLTVDLRRALDANACEHVPIYCPLYTTSRVLRDRAFLGLVAERIASGPVDAVWLAMNRFGTRTATSLTIRWYVNACREFHVHSVPVVGFHTGVVGILLMALGATGGMEAGITDGEIFDIEQYTASPPEPQPGVRPLGPTPRILLQSMGLYFTEKELREFFSQRGTKAAHLCQTGCCPRGLEDMIRNRIEHHVMSTGALVASLASVPPGLRATWYRDEYLRPAADKAMAASNAQIRIPATRLRLDDWRKAVGFFTGAEEMGAHPVSLVPTGRRRVRNHRMVPGGDS